MQALRAKCVTQWQPPVANTFRRRPGIVGETERTSVRHSNGIGPATDRHIYVIRSGYAATRRWKGMRASSAVSPGDALRAIAPANLLVRTAVAAPAALLLCPLFLQLGMDATPVPFDDPPDYSAVPVSVHDSEH